VIEEKKKNGLTFTEEDHELLELLRRKKLACHDRKKAITEEVFTHISSMGDFTTYARSSTDTHAHALASIPTIRASEWIVDSGASRHVTGAHHEFLTYTHLAAPESIQIADGTA
jgi:hypothetical protein